MNRAPESVRLIIDPPADGPLNMARDEALLDAVAAGKSPPTLRFYAWEAPTISLGYFQPWSEYQAQSQSIRDLPVVRRTTGGGAILHDLELTYSLAVPATSSWLLPNANQLYILAHRAIIASIGDRARMAGKCAAPGPCADAPGSLGHSQRAGPFFCFARRHEFDVVVPDTSDPTQFAKLAGSAQRRKQNAVLQHGSLILANRFPDHPCATWSDHHQSITYSAAVAHLAPEFERGLACILCQAAWQPSELRCAERLVGKYAGEEWTLGCLAVQNSQGPT